MAHAINRFSITYASACLHLHCSFSNACDSFPAHFDRDELFGKGKGCSENVKSERVGRVNANALTHLASKKAILNKSIETFCSLASSLQVEKNEYDKS